MAELRTAVLIEAPSRAVSAALIEVATLGNALAQVGWRVAGSHGIVLAPGDRLRAVGSVPFEFQLLDVEANGLAGKVTAAATAEGDLFAECSGTATGTQLTLALSWQSGTGRTQACRDDAAMLGAVLDAIADTVRSRAPELAEASVVVGAAIVRDGLLLAQQRGFPPEVAGRWELAGGRVEPGETDEQAVRRECLEELGVAVDPGPTVGPDVVLRNGMLLRIHRAELVDGTEPTAREHRGVRWVARDELAGMDWLPADRVFLPALRDLLG